jgi:hypothetical protein
MRIAGTRSADFQAYLEAEAKLCDYRDFRAARARLIIAPASMVLWARAAVDANCGHPVRWDLRPDAIY